MRPGSYVVYVVIVLLFVVGIARAETSEQQLPVAGWVENARLVAHELDMHAKLDTGAKTTSLNSVKPKFFERDGEEWVRFTVTNVKDKCIVIEAPIVRISKIKRHFEGRQERPVIELDICVGPVKRRVEVNLVDRTGLNYQLLIGRNFLANSLLIDSGSTYILPSVCSVP